MIRDINHVANALKHRLYSKTYFLLSYLKSMFESPLELQGSYEKLTEICPDEGKTCIKADRTMSSFDMQKNYLYDVQVVIPVYNASATLRQSVDSAICQKGDLKVWITIVNDGSTDCSGDILKEYESIQNIEIITQENRGFSGARNAALRNIKGKYVFFLDSDDYLPEDALISLYEMALATDCDIVQGSYFIFGETERLIRMPDMSKGAGITGMPWGKLFKAKYFEMFCFPEGYWFEDTLMEMMFVPVTPADKIASISTSVYYYRQNPQGISNNAYKSLKIIDTVFVTKRLYEDRKILGIPPGNDEYKQFLRQTIVNLKRVRRHGDMEILRLAFCAMRDMKDSYFSGAPQPDCQLKYLHQALTRGRFNQAVRLLEVL